MSEQEETTKGRDVGWAIADGETRPIREVIAERKTLARKYTRAQLDAAFRERAGMQAMLATCLCCYPLVKCEDTATGHESWCPAEGIYRSQERVRSGRLDVAVASGVELDRLAIERGDATEMTCPQCKATLADFDGFGVVAHLKSTREDGCGYCSHKLNRELVPGRGWVCGICDQVVELEQESTIERADRMEREFFDRELDVAKKALDAQMRQAIKLDISRASSVEYPSAHELDDAKTDGFTRPTIDDLRDSAHAALALDAPSEATLAATSGDRARIAKAFLEVAHDSPEHEVLLNALATKDVKRDGVK